jgi:signal transduction histidine kinase
MRDIDQKLRSELKKLLDDNRGGRLKVARVLIDGVEATVITVFSPIDKVCDTTKQQEKL